MDAAALRTVDLGRGARSLLGRPGVARVHSVHRRAFYLRIHGGLVAVTDPSAPPGPLHLRCTPGLPAVSPGQAVAVDGVSVRGVGWCLYLDAPTPPAVLPPPELLSDAVRPADVREVAALIGGRGPGLTPAGDDVLAGLALVARARGGPAAEDELLACVAAVETTSLAAAFLGWAARGESIAPAHEALGHLVGHREDPGSEARLAATGASSGEALLLGLRLGVRRGRLRPGGVLDHRLFTIVGID
ncbi:DUF2877 domain-containing protein [Pseudonocardia kujensis]|uniref:oxamate carbamoyltransferase subunit AllH family protein n=1 Tax=Pseudonocardia kujensis TaxID=1128675 RepID=UPI001E65AFC5|nr:DUF2877 domain-containing protein [Pseudonocardia kujensis]MCE0764273.1 DUF2877 domain-containing protein [Pseudonocardia kujensis]